ncbi:MAG: hypothetical protein IJ317_00165 [Clostridia bacterium]|nr:hypothetical protein [Clostridia bacterium]
MKSILKALYNGEITEWERPLGKLTETAEYKKFGECIERLEKTLTSEQETLFHEYYLADGGFENLVFERVYANAFKTGFWLAMELQEPLEDDTV